MAVIACYGRLNERIRSGHRPGHFLRRTASVAHLLLVGTVMLLPACPAQKECTDKSGPELNEIRVKNDRLQSEIVTLKRQLAQALASPCSIKIDEPMELNGEVKAAPPPKEGTLTMEQVIATMNLSKPVLKQCYERAMKKSVNLQREKITLNLGFRVLNSGTASDITIRPNYDNTMSDCMKKAINRVRFPAFSGQPVGVEFPLTLSPKR